MAVLDDVNVISPLHLPWRLKEKPTGRERLAVPDSLIVAQTPNLSEVPVVVDLALIDPFVHARAFDMFRVKLIAPNEKFLVIEVLFTVKESTPERYAFPVDPNCAQIRTSEPVASPRLIV